MSDGGAAVAKWLRDNDDTMSVVSSVSRVVASEYGEEFDDSKYVLRVDDEEPERLPSEDAAEVEACLGLVARGAQRKAVCQFRSLYTRGRMLDVPVYGRGQPSNQSFFRLEAFMEITSIDDPHLVKRLSEGVVRSRLGAMTGVGKTMLLPGKLAASCGIRVCQLELDTALANKAMSFQKEKYAIPGGVRAWSRTKKAFLTCMSYHEFRGIVLSGDRERLFSDFDLFYMDEAHEPLAPVWAARQYFAEFAQPHNSLLVASATVSTDSSNNVANAKAGVFKMEETPMSIREAMDSGRMLGEHLRDRTLVLVASDEDVAAVRAYYLEHGLKVVVLDSASVEADIEAVWRVLTPEADVIPRILVATQEYGTGYSFPLCYEISTCTRRVYELTATNTLIEKEVPLMSKGVVQHQGRLGRNLASGGGGWMLRSDSLRDTEILPTEAVEAYLSLVAANIRPRPGQLAKVSAILPKGIDADVARAVLRVGLPPALVVRYLGSDGRFAAKYADAVKLFTQIGEPFKKSKDEYPVGYDSWIDETVGGYYEGDSSSTGIRLKVPFESPPGLKIAIHTISAVSERHLDLEYWDCFDDDDESEDELVGVRTKVKRAVLPRLPDPVVKQKDKASVTTAFQPWTYDADPNDAVKRKRRHGMSWNVNGEGRGAVIALLRAIENQSLGVAVANPVINNPEFEGKVVYPLPLEEEGAVPVKSPGGGKILLVSRRTHEAFMAGDSLDVTNATELVKYIVEIRAVERFAKSTVFDNWSPAWLCWFTTFHDSEVVTAWKNKGVHSDAVKLLNFLYERFRVEVLAVSASSNLYKSSLGTFVRSKPSVTRLVKAFKDGRLPVAQSDAFVNKVLEIKEAYDLAVLALEEANIYAPKLVTKAQGKLPIRDGGRRMPVIDEKVVPPLKVGISNQTRWRS